MVEMVMFRRELKRHWIFLAVELAVQLQVALEGKDNEDYPPYEYYPEALEIVKYASEQSILDEAALQQKFAEVFSRNLDFEYKADDFQSSVKFLEKKFAYFRKYF